MITLITYSYGKRQLELMYGPEGAHAARVQGRGQQSAAASNAAARREQRSCERRPSAGAARICPPQLVDSLLHESLANCRLDSRPSWPSFESSLRPLIYTVTFDRSTTGSLAIGWFLCRQRLVPCFDSSTVTQTSKRSVAAVCFVQTENIQLRIVIDLISS